MPDPRINEPPEDQAKKATFSEIAPNLARVKTETDIETDFPANPKSTPAPAPPEMTDARIAETYEKLKNIEVNNGYLGIARSVGLSHRQVRQLHGEIKQAINFGRTGKAVKESDPEETVTEEPVI